MQKIKDSLRLVPEHVTHADRRNLWKTWLRAVLVVGGAVSLALVVAFACTF